MIMALSASCAGTEHLNLFHLMCVLLTIVVKLYFCEVSFSLYFLAGNYFIVCHLFFLFCGIYLFLFYLIKNLLSICNLCFFQVLIVLYVKE